MLLTPLLLLQLPFPRHAFSVQNSRVLHSRTCGGFDASKCVPRTFASHKVLEAWVTDEGCVLCPKCRF
jgi:hypothetical protein